MKKSVLLFLLILLTAGIVQAARQTAPTTGRVVDASGKAVDFATVVLLRDGLQAAGTTADSEGRFALNAAAGRYTLQVQHLNFETCTRDNVEAGTDLGEIVLTAAAKQIDAVVVQAQLIRREADRFVVDVANSAAAIGKDGVELLERAPGVWINDDQISINGKSGSKVYVNDRELKMSGDQLLTYIRNLRTEDIQKIEVIPVSGADYDADSASGIIKITLRRRRENGLQGSLSFQTRQGKYIEEYNPAGNIDLHHGRVDLRLQAYGDLGSQTMRSTEETRYTNGTLASRSEQIAREKRFGGSFSTVIELAPAHSIGFGADYRQQRDPAGNDSRSQLMTDEPRSTESRFERLDRRKDWSAMMNYVWKIDTLGSTFKLLGDYTRRNSDSDNDNRSTVDGLDSLHRNFSRTDYTMATVNAALEKNFSPRWSLRAGAKYTYYLMESDALYEYRTTGDWITNERECFDIDYTEQIGAAYGILAGKFGRFNFVAGLRGEYTHAESDGSRIARDYFSLFPNANLSYALDKKGRHLFIAQYARKISRPSFWQLNPQREQISDYLYQTGNPALDPSYTHDLSLTLVLAQKYTLTGGLLIRTDEIQQTCEPSAEDPNVLVLTNVNYKDSKSAYANLNLPMQPAKWWEITANGTYIYMGHRLSTAAPEVFHHAFQSNVSTTFTLPRKFYIDLSWMYHTRFYLANAMVHPEHRIDISVKKKFGKHFTATCSVRNLFDQRNRAIAWGEGFDREIRLASPWQSRQFRFRLTYNFKSGKAFRARTVEGDQEGQSRL